LCLIASTATCTAVTGSHSAICGGVTLDLARWWTIAIITVTTMLGLEDLRDQLHELFVVVGLTIVLLILGGHAIQEHLDHMRTGFGINRTGVNRVLTDILIEAPGSGQIGRGRADRELVEPFPGGAASRGHGTIVVWHLVRSFQ
jgi:hypothetical protein